MACTADARLRHTGPPSKIFPRFSYMLRTLAFSLTVLAGTSVLANTACPQHFAAGQRPVVTNPKMQPRTQELCFKAFAVLHSGLSRTPLYAAEHLTRQNMKNAAKLSRKDSFHAEDALPEGDRAELSDYERSGYDRGHLQYPVKNILIS
ncbi:DNA/RNA endonuclease G NUC1-like protein [Polaromonas naphthalenivorans CJ2]|uniref:DNA/RNA endonuclease G NUC1-like protein n=2 Tax=Polaromonas naphthalenivorans TaxID=216465 RepID=A1VJW4_POLNA|nr:DNA/RNA endonuclease G NUC1-like protein [Polaromonas naphthalenivorans CJ2]